MKRIVALGLVFMLLLGVSCKREEEDNPYRIKSLAEYVVAYKEGEFVFPKAYWDASEEEWLKNLGFTRDDVVDMPEKEDSGFKSFYVKKFLYFEDVACRGAMSVTFLRGKLYSVTISLVNDDLREETRYRETIWEDGAGMEQYPPVEDLSNVCAVLADGLEANGIPEPIPENGYHGSGSIQGIREGGGAIWHGENGMDIPLEIVAQSPSHMNPPNQLRITIWTNTRWLNSASEKS